MTNSKVQPLDRRICVAPMMDWTDRHCRFLHRLFAPHALLYTEMIVASAIVRGNSARLLYHHAAEQPVALQLGGCCPQELAAAARLGERAGYAEINLNVGCPSDRVRNGAFGACLMRDPPLVAECVRRMREAVRVPITVKCRIGVDERADYGFFSRFADAVAAAGIDALIVHARAAILGGLTPKENREVPPLKYDYVYRLKRELASLPVIINGGLIDAPSAAMQFSQGVDGVMLGRAAYHRPATLAELECTVVDRGWRVPEPLAIIERIVAYAQGEARLGVRLHSITRHMHGLLAGRQGARAWRRFLSEVAGKPDARPEHLFSAFPIVKRGMAAETAEAGGARLSII